MAQLTNIHDYMNTVSTRVYRKGDKIFSEGEISNGKMYFVFEGELSVIRKKIDGEKEVGVLQMGAFFGEMALIKPRSRGATIQVKSGVCKLGIIDKESFLKLSKTEPGFLFVLLKSVIERLTYAEERIEALELENAKLSDPRIRSIDLRS